MKIIDKIRGYKIKAIIFRKNMPTITDKCKRIDSTTYRFKKLKINLPSPPSNDFVHIINKEPTIYLYNPRVGTYIYLRPPEVKYNPSNNKMTIEYFYEHFNKNKKSKEIELTKAEPISVTMELYDHQDKAFLIHDKEVTDEKYYQQKSWFEKYFPIIVNIAYLIGIAVALYIIYVQIVFPSADHAIRPTINVVCNATKNVL